MQEITIHVCARPLLGTVTAWTHAFMLTFIDASGGLFLVIAIIINCQTEVYVFFSLIVSSPIFIKIIAIGLEAFQIIKLAS